MCCLKPSATVVAEIGLSQLVSVSGPLSVRSGANGPSFALTWSWSASANEPFVSRPVAFELASSTLSVASAPVEVTVAVVPAV